jgi:hypothetical protein
MTIRLYFDEDTSDADLLEASSDAPPFTLAQCS